MVPTVLTVMAGAALGGAMALGIGVIIVVAVVVLVLLGAANASRALRQLYS